MADSGARDANVVITGLGVVSPVGNDIESFWRSVCEGRSGIQIVDRFDVSQHASKMAGLSEDCYPQDLAGKHLRRLDRYTLFALYAADQAWIQSGLDIGRENPQRCGAVIGSGIGGIHTFETEYFSFYEKGPRRVHPLTIPKLMGNAAAAETAARLGLRGPNKAIVSACATGSHNLGEAANLIRCGQADVMVTGGTEGAITSFGLAAFAAMRAMSRRNDEPERASRPFDADRDGFVMSEGAGILVLESEEHARARGAEILGTMMGYGETCDAYHIAAPRPDGSGAIGAMRVALDQAGLNPEDVDYFNAHGTSTKHNDTVESLALRRVFGDDMPPVSSTKSMLGHLMGAAGAVEAIASMLSIRDGILPPSINYDTPDPECPVNIVANEAREARVAIAMSNSLGFGGHNTSILLRRYE